MKFINGLIMSMLPPGFLQHDYPATGKGFNPVIETDGDTLILRRVKIKDKFYDLRITRFDANNHLIYMDGNTQFSKQMILEVRNLAVDLFQNHFQSPVGTKIWYTDNCQAGKACELENVKLPNSDKHKYTRMIPGQENSPIVTKTALIHHQFFHATESEISLDPDAIISPKAIRKEELPAPVETQEEAPKKKRKKSLPNDFMDQQLPNALKDAETSTDESVETSTSTTTPASSAPTKEEHREKLQEVLDVVPAVCKGTGYLNDITYTALAAYAQSPDPEKEPALEEAYQAYVKVLSNPDSTENADVIEMKKWLKHHYKVVLGEYIKIKAVWEANKDGKTFDQWCKYYAAKAIAGFILVEQKKIDLLVADLQKPEVHVNDSLDRDAVPVSTPANRWWWWPAFLSRNPTVTTDVPPELQRSDLIINDEL